ncbi:CARDB domain-containing protein [Pyxidicoccus trucidator]|uniref:CARDB domain-containing protein n=1 Tax=Pyxidicoccus trucidator TaxID=2709662 RepID=UPI0013DB6157|nr:CARDB domain-containing protein [Pyxidicoccus trucidator]
MRSRCVTGLGAWLALAACGEAPQASQAPEAVSPGVTAQALAKGPDFVVASVTGPTSVQSGQPTYVAVRACNQGGFTGSANVELYLSSDNIITPNTPTSPTPDLMVGYVVMSLKAGECRTEQAQVVASVSVQGAYFLGAAADPMNQLMETNEANNLQLGSRIGVGDKPDLVVSSITAPISTPPSQPFTVSVSVCNQGTQSGGGLLELYLSGDANIVSRSPPSPLSDLLVGSLYFQSLAPGQCRTEQVRSAGGGFGEGLWYVGAIVDPGNSTPELIEDNNTRLGSRIGVGNMPELVVTAVSGPASLPSGGYLSITATVCNQGTQPGSARLEWYVSQDAVITPRGTSADLPIAYDSIEQLAPGQCVTRTYEGYPGWIQGQYYLGAMVDPLNGTPEFFEDNNTRVGSRMGFGDGPDFVVSSVSGTSSAMPGASISAAVRVCNQGTASGGADVELYLSQDVIITPTTTPGPNTDRPVGLGHVDLAAGACRTLTVTGSASVPEQAYYLGAVVDPRGVRAELLEDNNTHAGNLIGVGFRADFVVTALSGPKSAPSGQSFNVTATVCNQGTREDSSHVEIVLSQDSVITPNHMYGPHVDTRIGYGRSNPLAPGACQTLTITTYGYGPADGMYYLGAAADPVLWVSELIEDNNTLTGSLFGWGYRPDFVVTTLSGPTSVLPYESFNVSAQVCNQGTQTERAHAVEIYLSEDTVITPNRNGSGPDVLVGLAPVDMLTPGQCQTVTVSVFAGSSEGAWYLGAVVDPLGMAMEFIEDNNTRAGSRIGVGAESDFVVTSVTAPSSVQVGQSFTASATVCNQGTWDGSTDMAVYLSEDTVITPYAYSPYPPSPDYFVGSVYVDYLAPGQCQTVSIYAYASGVPAGSYNVGAVVDVNGGTSNELIEDNNTRVGGLTNVLP